MSAAATAFARQFFYGTRADLKPGDMLVVDYASNFGSGTPLSWIYLTGTLDAAIWGAELAVGDARERIYLVEPTAAIVDDPNVTDKKFPWQSDAILLFLRAFARGCRGDRLARASAGATAADEGRSCLAQGGRRRYHYRLTAKSPPATAKCATAVSNSSCAGALRTLRARDIR